MACTIRELASCIEQIMPGPIEVIYGCHVQFDKSYREAACDSVREALRQAGGDVSQAERMLNHVHITDMLVSLHGEAEPDDMKVIGRAYAALLYAELTQKFPEHQFKIEVLGEDQMEKDPLAYQITFYSTGPRVVVQEK